MYYSKLKQNALILGWMIMIFAPLSTFAQYKHPFEFNKMGFGFEMGLNANRYLTKSQYGIWDNGVLLDDITVLTKPGLNLGIISYLNLGNNMALRFIPALALEERHFKFHFTKPYDTTEIRRVEAAYLDLPLMFQVRSDLYKRTRLYVAGGPELSFNFQSNKKLKTDPTLLKIQDYTFGATIAVGYNLYGDRGKISPEIRYTVGFTNDYVPRNTSHPNAISKLYRQVITLNFLFE